MQATTTLSQMERVSILTAGFVLSLNWKGNIFCQNRITTARIAPSWITTKNISLKASLMFRVRNSSTNSMCPVLLMGSHSVTPSTMPRKMTFKISVKLRAIWKDLLASRFSLPLPGTITGRALLRLCFSPEHYSIPTQDRPAVPPFHSSPRLSSAVMRDASMAR